MDWSVSEARRRFAELLEKASTEPQRIVNRDRFVGAVVDPEAYEEFLVWKESRRASMAALLGELKEVCEQEQYDIEVPERDSRPTPFDCVE